MIDNFFSYSVNFFSKYFFTFLKIKTIILSFITKPSGTIYRNISSGFDLRHPDFNDLFMFELNSFLVWWNQSDGKFPLPVLTWCCWWKSSLVQPGWTLNSSALRRPSWSPLSPVSERGQDWDWSGNASPSPWWLFPGLLWPSPCVSMLELLIQVARLKECDSLCCPVQVSLHLSMICRAKLALAPFGLYPVPSVCCTFTSTETWWLCAGLERSS